MSKKIIKFSNPKEMLKALNLTDDEILLIEFRHKIVEEIITLYKKRGFTHEELAKEAETGRTKITSILNYSLTNISTDLLLRVLIATGGTPELHVKHAA